jgi:hypothetical protein
LGDIIKTQWVELHFICEKPFLETLEYKIEPIPTNRWDNDPNLSSGVGWQITNRLFDNGLNMYHPKDPNSIGFILRISKYQFRVRWSKRTRKWFWGLERSYYA